MDVQSPCSIIAAVGDGMSSTTGVSGRFFTALGDARINVLAISQGCSERNISAVVRSEESTRALRAVHAAFRLSSTTVRVGVLGGSNEIGWGHHIGRKGQQGYSRLYQKSYLTYLDSSDDKEDEEWGKGNSEEEEKEEGGGGLGGAGGEATLAGADT